MEDSEIIKGVEAAAIVRENEYLLITFHLQHKLEVTGGEHYFPSDWVLFLWGGKEKSHQVRAAGNLAGNTSAKSAFKRIKEYLRHFLTECPVCW